ncbi:MAG: glucose-6-phosphate isomerase [Gammaproteobacteria bacterium]|nr:glucose-6-phosphate isomerase [Gammaproteobacteria bacterium]
MTKITELTPWISLVAHQKEIASHSMRDWFNRDSKRFERFSLRVGDILVDYSRNRIDENTINLFIELGLALDLEAKIKSLFAGDAINFTEKQPALHPALRDLSNKSLTLNGQNISTEIATVKNNIAFFVDKILSGEWKGSTGKAIQTIVNLGIGGSYLGPLMTTEALADFSHGNLHSYFLSGVDDAYLHDVLNQIDPETTLFIISSKSFSTIETLTNAKSIRHWLKTKLGDRDLKQHFIAITANSKKAIEFGIESSHIFPIWNWVGGRYSIWSAIGLPLALMIGNENFKEFLAGADEMDQHFRSAPLGKNLPFILALLDIWYINFFGATAKAIAPYGYRLRHFVSYLQQAEMESNGKSVTLKGEHVQYTTSTVIFGQEGCDGQHAYHQLLHQGTQMIPVDFIIIGKNHYHETANHHDILMASCLSQAQALMRGKTIKEAKEELLASHHTDEEAEALAPHHMIPGNKPSNILLIDELTPKNLGALIALYEHKIFVESVIWNINAFDQFGVELGKQLLPKILNLLQNEDQSISTDCATTALIAYYQKLKSR